MTVDKGHSRVPRCPAQHLETSHLLPVMSALCSVHVRGNRPSKVGQDGSPTLVGGFKG